MKTFVRVLGFCAVAGFALTGCGGGSSEGSAPESISPDTVEAPDPAVWAKENCPAKGWFYEDKNQWVFTQVVVTPNPAFEEYPEERSRQYVYDELTDTAQIVGFTDMPICAERDQGKKQTAKDASTGETVYLTQVKTPYGDAWITEYESRISYWPDREGPEQYGVFTPVNELNDLKNIEVADGRPTYCTAVGCA